MSDPSHAAAPSPLRSPALGGRMEWPEPDSSSTAASVPRVGPAWAAPSLRTGGRLDYAFDEDEVTLAWDAARHAGLARGTRIAAAGVDLPSWWWQGTGFVAAPDGVRLLLAHTGVGDVCLVGPGDVEAVARKAWATRVPTPADVAKRHHEAREAPDGPADQPLGAAVTLERHNAVLAMRMRLGVSRVVSWTRIETGAAPTEFLRLQAAIGAYHVVLVEHAHGKTVGLWTGETQPRQGMEAIPVLRRLLRQEGRWRHGIKFTALSPSL